MNIRLGNAARALRDQLGLSQRDAAKELGISFVHLCNIEKDRKAPSSDLLDRYRELWGVDLYVYAWCQESNLANLPSALRSVATKLQAGWESQISKAISVKKHVGNNDAEASQT